MTQERLPYIPRDLLDKYFHQDPRLVAAFEEQARAVAQTSQDVIAATDALADATVVSLSSNASFNNEYVLANGDGTQVDATPGAVSIGVDATVARVQGGRTEFMPPGNVTLGLPVEGTLVSDTAPAALSAKTLDQPSMSGLVNAASDGAAASLGVPIGGVYHNAGALRVRIS